MRNDGRHPGGALPDLDDDAGAIAAYEQAKLQYIRGITDGAEEKLRDTLAQRRALLNAEIGRLRMLRKVHHDVAVAATQRYASIVPQRVRKAGLLPPTFFERIVTFDAALRRYTAARAACEQSAETVEALRQHRDQLDAMERETRRSIQMREEAVRKKLQTPEGLAALHGDARVRAAFATMQGVLNARARSDERAKKGDAFPAKAPDGNLRG